MRRFPPLIQAYILVIIVTGGVVLLLGLPSQVDRSELILFITLVAGGVLAGLHPLPLVGRHAIIDLTGGILLMAVLLASPSMACLLAAVVSVASGLVLRRRLWNVLFNAGAEVLGIGLAGALYHGVANPASLPLDCWINAVALFLASASYWLVESALVTVLVAARNREPFLQTYAKNWQEVYVQCTLLALLAVLGTAAWHQGVVYAFLLLVPAVAVYQLMSITKLKQEQVIHAIEIIAEVLDRKNPFTFQHSHRVAEHTVRIARQIGLRPTDAEVLRRAALIHDIGKLGMDDPSGEIPANREELSEYQFYSLKQHAHLGAMIAREIPAFEEAEEPIRYHHDWYDGSHVSREHSGEEIPLGARIIAVADAYDLLCMANGEASLTYDPKAVEQLRTMGGQRLDPELLGRFLEMLESEQAVRLQPAGLPAL
ncbi:MAG: HD-GYP domain-containing protein [Chloroflexota bacterium]